MAETIETYCLYCDHDVSAALLTRNETLPVRNVPTEFSATVAICPECGQEIGDSRLEERNLSRAYDAYRESRGMLAGSEISGLRAKYGLSLREFSRFLGFGEQTYARYERGALQDEAHDRIMKMALTPDGARALLGDNEEKLSPGSAEKIRQVIKLTPSTSSAASGLAKQIVEIAAAPQDVEGEDWAHGNRLFDIDRVRAMVYWLSEFCDNLYVTKLQKAAFSATTVPTRSLANRCQGLAMQGQTMGR